jgi:hypothetical protein
MKSNKFNKPKDRQGWYQVYSGGVVGCKPDLEEAPAYWLLFE